MMQKYVNTLAGVVVMLLSTAGWAQSEMVIYPTKNQTKEQQDKDNFECYGWAKQQSGFDPMAPPTASAPPPQQEAQQGGVGRGAVRGGLVGVGVGAIAGDAGKGAAIGAALGNPGQGAALGAAIGGFNGISRGVFGRGLLW